jgi:hypothetical protein
MSRLATKIISKDRGSNVAVADLRTHTIRRCYMPLSNETSAGLFSRGLRFEGRAVVVILIQQGIHL